MNRFYDIPKIPCNELSPWEIKRLGLDIKSGWFENAERWRINSTIAGGDIWMEVGELSDLASIPILLQSLTMAIDDPRIGLGSWPHDKLFKAGGRVAVYAPDGTFIGIKYLSFKQCNQILCDELMPDLGASPLDRWKVYKGLQLGGWANFKKPVDKA